MAALRTQMPSLASRPHITSHTSVDIGRRTASSFSVAEPKTVVNAIRFRRPDGGCPDKASFKSSGGGLRWQDENHTPNVVDDERTLRKISRFISFLPLCFPPS